MQLTGKQIVEKNIISNYAEEGVQQQGLDVRLRSVLTLCGSGHIPAKGKTTKCGTTKIHLGEGVESWILSPGYYELEFEEGCNIPANYAMYFKTRSSLVRCGAIIHSGQFDGGFETNNMGAFLLVTRTITIDKGARVAQAIVNETYEVESQDLYNGQWQNDNQREEEISESTDDVVEVSQEVEIGEPSTSTHTPTKNKKRKRKN